MIGNTMRKCHFIKNIIIRIYNLFTNHENKSLYQLLLIFIYYYNGLTLS